VIGVSPSDCAGVAEPDNESGRFGVGFEESRGRQLCREGPFVLISRLSTPRSRPLTGIPQPSAGRSIGVLRGARDRSRSASFAALRQVALAPIRRAPELGR